MAVVAAALAAPAALRRRRPAASPVEVEIEALRRRMHDAREALLHR